MLRRLLPAFFAFVPFVVVSPAAGAPVQLPRVSPKATVTQTIGLTDLTVTYSRPGVKGRKIWGDLVPYDKPWRTGANEATTFTNSTEIEFGGKKLAAGTYALLTIPAKDKWTVVLNQESDLWGSNEYKKEKDVLRVDVKPTGAEPQEWMALTFEDLTPQSGNLVLRWEKLRVAVPITVDANGMALASARTAIAEMKPDDWQTPYQAANWCLGADTALEEGRTWLDKSLAIQKTYNNLNCLARWEMKSGHKTEAIAAAKQAIAAGKASKEKVDVAPTEKLLSDWMAAK